MAVSAEMPSGNHPRDPLPMPFLLPPMRGDAADVADMHSQGNGHGSIEAMAEFKGNPFPAVASLSTRESEGLEPSLVFLSSKKAPATMENAFQILGESQSIVLNALDLAAPFQFHYKELATWFQLLPPHETVELLIAYYYDELHVWFPFLRRGQFHLVVRRLYDCQTLWNQFFSRHSLSESELQHLVNSIQDPGGSPERFHRNQSLREFLNLQNQFSALCTRLPTYSALFLVFSFLYYTTTCFQRKQGLHDAYILKTQEVPDFHPASAEAGVTLPLNQVLGHLSKHLYSKYLLWDACNLESIQGSLLCALGDLSSVYSTSWTLIGMACQWAKTIRLNESTPPKAFHGLTKWEADGGINAWSRVHTWVTCFCLDRLIGTLQGRQLNGHFYKAPAPLLTLSDSHSLSSSQILSQLALDEQPDPPISVFFEFLTRILEILGEIGQVVNEMTLATLYSAEKVDSYLQVLLEMKSKIYSELHFWVDSTDDLPVSLEGAFISFYFHMSTILLFRVRMDHVGFPVFHPFFKLKAAGFISIIALKGATNNSSFFEHNIAIFQNWERCYSLTIQTLDA
jgi:hypothetical protein